MTSFTLLIPTYNRSALLRRLLSYFETERFAHPIVVADSSESMTAEENEKMLKNSSLSITRVPFDPSIDVFDKIIGALGEISTSHVGMCADDDFLARRAPERAIAFLENHPEYAAAEGRSVTCSVENGQVRVVPFPQHPIENASASDRLSRYMADPTAYFYAIHRREFLADTLDRICRHRTDNTRFEELGVSAMTAIKGKVAVIDGLHLVRQTSGHRADSGSRHTGGWKHVLASPTFERNRERFESMLSGALAHEGVPERDAAELAARSFKMYLEGVHTRRERDTRYERIVAASLIPSAPTKTRRLIQKTIGAIAMLGSRTRSIRSEFKPISQLLAAYPDGITETV